MPELKSLIRSLVFALVALAAVTPAAFAQTRVRVTKDQTAIWRPGFLTVATIVRSGTILDVIARQGDWYEVALPQSAGEAPQTGLIMVIQVERVEGSRPAVARSPAAARGEPSVGAGLSRTGLRGFAHVGYDWLNAHKTFDAVLGHPGGPLFGGGAEFRFGGLFVQGSVDRFQRTGERVFVFNGEVLRLGIPDTIAITPVALTAGYRFTHHKVTAYAGGGAGRYFFKESTPIDSSETVRRHFTSYHVLGGVEGPGNRWMATALELQYTLVPDALHSDTATAFNEHNLGGIEARAKILLGR